MKCVFLYLILSGKRIKAGNEPKHPSLIYHTEHSNKKTDKLIYLELEQPTSVIGPRQELCIL